MLFTSCDFFLNVYVLLVSPFFLWFDPQEKKKLKDCFPIDLDVDKFLSSLHYDE